MSFSTTAAALQNEMNVSAMVVATTTLAGVPLWMDFDGFISLEARFQHSRDRCGPPAHAQNHKDHLVSVPLQHLHQEQRRGRPPRPTPSDHDERSLLKRVSYGLVTIAAEIYPRRNLGLLPVDQLRQNPVGKRLRDGRRMERQWKRNYLREENYEPGVQVVRQPGSGPDRHAGSLGSVKTT